MDKFFKLLLNPTAEAGTPPYSMVDEAGDTPNAATLASLAQQLTWLAKEAQDREDAARLVPGMYYWFRSKHGIVYVQFRGFDAKGPRVLYTDKAGTPVGYGVKGESYYDAYPVARLTLMKHQPVAATPA